MSGNLVMTLVQTIPFRPDKFRGNPLGGTGSTSEKSLIRARMMIGVVCWQSIAHNLKQHVDHELWNSLHQMSLPARGMS